MALTEFIAPLLAEVKDKPRLRVGLLLVVGIFWIYGLLLLRDSGTLAASEQQTLAKKVARIQAQSRQTEWTARVEPALALQIELESRLWREGTIGLAQATFQDWLNQNVQQSNLTRSAVTVAAQEESAPEKSVVVKRNSDVNRDIWKISAKVGFDFTPKDFYAFLGRVEGHDKQVIVESLVVRVNPVPRVEMVLVAHFQKPAATEKLTISNARKTEEIRP